MIINAMQHWYIYNYLLPLNLAAVGCKHFDCVDFESRKMTSPRSDVNNANALLNAKQRAHS